MNRRTFLADLLKGAAAFTILPGAGRVWKAERQVISLYDKLPFSIEYYESPIFKFLPSFQDFLRAKEGPETEVVFEKLIQAEPWPPNMEEVNDNKSRALDVFLQGHRESGTVHQMDVLLHRKRSTSAPGMS